MEGGKLASAHHACTLEGFLRDRRDELIAEWIRVARTIPRARELSEVEILDHFPRLLDRLIGMVADMAHGREPALPDREAHEHVMRRLEEGFDLREIVQEYTVLRCCILRLWRPKHEGGHEALLLHAAIDRAISASVNRYTEARSRTLHALDRVASAALAAPDLNALLDRLLRVLAETTLAVDTAAIFLCQDNRLCARAAVGVEEDVKRNFSLAFGEGFVGKIAQEGVPLEIRQAADDPLVISPALRARGVRALYGVPLLDGGRLIGVAYMGSRSTSEFSEEDKRLFQVMVVRASAAIQLHRVREEETARARELKRLDRLISSHPDFFYLIGPQHRFLYASPSLLSFWQLSHENVLGKTFKELGYPAHLVAKHHEQLERSFQGETVRGENSYTNSKGVHRHYEYIFTPVLGSDDTIEAVAGVTRDITDRTRHEEELRNTLAFRERLIGILGHDLKTPLSSATMSVQLLLRREDLPQAYFRPLARVARSAEHMARVIDDIVEFARSRHDASLPLFPVEVDLAEMCRESVEDLRMMGHTNIRLETNGDCQGCWDRDRLMQVVANLTANAVRHGSPGQLATVRVQGEPEHVALEVHNFGPPISSEELQHIFEPFRTTAQRTGGGLGLGLYIVREIVASHCGTIEVHSTEEDGTRFRIVLPKKRPAK